MEALSKLAPSQAKIVDLRYFGGLSEEETNQVLKIAKFITKRNEASRIADRRLE